MTDEMKRSFFQAAVVSILLYGCTTWTITKRLEKKLDATTQKCWERYWTNPGDNTPRDSNCTATCLPSRKLYRLDEPDTPDTAGEARTSTYGQAKAGRPARTYIQQLCEDTGCNPEDLPEAMNDREKWREMFKDIRADDDDIYIYIYIYTIPSARAGYDTPSIFKRSLTGLSSEFSFS